MAKQPKVDVGLYLQTVERDGYFHINAFTVVLNTDGQGSVRNPDNRYDLINGLYLDGLKATSQGNNTMYSRYGGGDVPNTDPKLYGFELHYMDVYAIGQREAERMAKTLKLVNKRLAKLNESHGYVHTFGEFLTRVAQAIGAQTVVVPQGRETPGWSYSDREHRFLTLSEARYHVDRLEAEWRKRIIGEPEPVAE